MPKTGHTKIVLVVDASGSMSSLRSATIKSINDFLLEQATVEGTADVSLVTFNSKVQDCYTDLDILDARVFIGGENYITQGNTALYDAIGFAINRTGASLAKLPEAQRAEKVVILIMTDGQENASSDFTRTKIREMVEHQRTKYNWQFVFLGANQDAFLTGGSLGIPRGSTMTYAATGQGVNQVSKMSSNSITRYRTGVGGFSCVDYTEEERKAIEETLKNK